MTEKTKMRLLLIDDNEDLLLALSDFLSQEFEVVRTSDAREAMKIFSEDQPFDIVVSDYMLPVYDGINLFKRFRAENPWLCTVIMTVHCSLGLALRAVNSGNVDRIVSKPFNNKDMLKAIESAVEQRGIKLKALPDQLNDSKKANGPDG
ncbi:MAG: response regulator [Candidatus Electryonea clarkiae]|nr:response regulator [Candidatus Electryonea clarkiae]MDP8287322.1 response regulator [Candidatus Electryonea clarkiae]